MGLKEEHRLEMLAATRDAATALLEDLDHIRKTLLSRELSRAELRGVSNILRRLLVERDIAKVATPRIGRFLLIGPDTKEEFKRAGTGPLHFFSGARLVIRRPKALQESPDLGPLDTDAPYPPPIAKMRLDGFLNQYVLCLEGAWVTRAQTIKYCANIASGVHSGTPSAPHEITLRSLRQRVQYVFTDNGLAIQFKLPSADADDAPIAYNPGAFDPVLMELLSTANIVVLSDDTRRLEAAIQEELSLPPRQAAQSLPSE